MVSDQIRADALQETDIDVLTEMMKSGLEIQIRRQMAVMTRSQRLRDNRWVANLETGTYLHKDNGRDK